VSHPASPPEPPPRRAPPKPDASGRLSTDDKEALTLRALGLLNEQVQARIVHYRGDLETNAELDAITAQVVQQLKTMQTALGRTEGEREPPERIAARQTATLAGLLGRVCKEGETGSLVTQNLKTIGRRIAKLFFESELHEKTKGDKDKVIHHPEQGVYYVLQRYKHRIRTELEGFDYTDDDGRTATLELLTKMERDLQVAFLSRRSPELNRVMTVFSGVLLDFFHKHLPPRLEQMAKITIRNAATATQPNSVSYKILPDRFEAFRAEWERLLMQQMVNFCGDEIFGKLTASNDPFHQETIAFFTDPHVFSETCEVICHALYDYLCLEGFLDLPVDWRMQGSAE
jgi:hypothetical protein